MTKGADGSTRVISQPIPGSTKSAQSDGVTSKVNSTPQKDGPQKVQIIRTPDGKLTVRGLLAGQQLIQMPDGKLHIVMAGQQGVTGQLVAASSGTNKPVESGNSPAEVTQVKTAIEEQRQTPRTAASTAQQVVVQGNRQIVVQPAQQLVAQPQQQVVVAPAQQVLVQAGARAGTPRMQAVQTVLVQGQLLPRPAAPRTPAVAPRPIVQAPRPRPAQAQQIVVNNPVLVQQIAAGKIQLATVNGQQVLIRPTGNNQAQIVAHIGQSPSAVSAAPVPSPAPAVRPTPPPLAPQPAPPPVQPQPQQQLTEDEIVEKRLLIGQPPGTVIKTVTAQVIMMFVQI